MKRRMYLAGMSFSALALALLVFAFVTPAASAHEKRNVGPYTFVVGFLNEPAYAGQENSIDFTICKGNQCNYTVQDGLRVVANPVNNANQTLKAEVSQGGAASLALPLEARYANPGKYASYFVPSKVGTYTFHIFGTLSGMKIDEKFVSGPNTFSDAEQIHVYPSANTQNAQTTQAATSTQSQTPAQVQAAQNSANTAMTLGIVGIIVGVLGLAAAGFALTHRPTGATAQQPASKAAVEDLRG